MIITDKTLVSFKEVSEAELANEPLVPGQILFVRDTYELYHTRLNGTRKLVSSNLSVVDTLPTSQIQKNHLYILIDSNGHGKLYIYKDGQWINLSQSDGGTVDLEDFIQASSQQPISQEVGGLWLIIDN